MKKIVIVLCLFLLGCFNSVENEFFITSSFKGAFFEVIKNKEKLSNEKEIPVFPESVVVSDLHFSKSFDPSKKIRFFYQGCLLNEYFMEDIIKLKENSSDKDVFTSLYIFDGKSLLIIPRNKYNSFKHTFIPQNPPRSEVCKPSMIKKE